MSCHENSCDTDGSCSPAKQHHGTDCCTSLAEDLVCLAKCAKEELLKEKMKKALEAKIGKKLDTVANLAVDAALACLKQELEGKVGFDEYKNSLLEVLKS